ncbi:light-harvesting protein B-800-850 alpha chain [Rhodovulum imhoffii]|uniref:Antenna pigment protein alpha chain n=1 Tax=Rhodovulum imhoffii TaxID=365340 RepID=A0A2T5BRA8_9RHOB|nr:light-harvesting protein [Rhodovulum imhoffii]MBK5934446.1 light-harvesting protein [Rhodovulum imhoffii]PTN01793.1 light-harvesting protein B-800-850 alpha chain [Rhodovulum imhoffii]
MNNAKVWLVVKPTVGVPVFLAAVAIASFLVHLVLVLNTGWMQDYYMGSAAETAAITVAAPETTA